jgi:hypothetical protein
MEHPMSSTKTFASAADLEEKSVSFDRLSEHAYAYTAEGDPNTGIIIGDDAVMVLDTQATPVMAQRPPGIGSRVSMRGTLGSESETMIRINCIR